MTATIPTCPSCGESYKFGFFQTYQSTASGAVVGTDEDGNLLVEWYDGGNPERHFRPQIECSDCGYIWTTRRTWRSISPGDNGSEAQP